jgi:hypothetical protein
MYAFMRLGRKKEKRERTRVARRRVLGFCVCACVRAYESMVGGVGRDASEGRGRAVIVCAEDV